MLERGSRKVTRRPEPGERSEHRPVHAGEGSRAGAGRARECGACREVHAP
jgi:hypothetical protein